MFNVCYKIADAFKHIKRAKDMGTVHSRAHTTLGNVNFR